MNFHHVVATGAIFCPFVCLIQFEKNGSLCSVEQGAWLELYYIPVLLSSHLMTSLRIHLLHTAQRLMISKSTKRAKVYHITVILQYCWDKTIARGRDMYSDDSGILSLVIKCFGITNTSVQKFAIWTSSVQKSTEVFAENKSSLNKFNIDVSYVLMSSLRAIVICQKKIWNHVISSQIHLFAPLLNMRHCSLCVGWSASILGRCLLLTDICPHLLFPGVQYIRWILNRQIH